MLMLDCHYIRFALDYAKEDPIMQFYASIMPYAFHCAGIMWTSLHRVQGIETIIKITKV